MGNGYFFSIKGFTCSFVTGCDFPCNPYGVVQRCQVQKPAMHEIFKSSPPPPPWKKNCQFRRPFEIAAQLFVSFLFNKIKKIAEI